MKKIKILHSYYGCDTGCCGHIIEVDGEADHGSFTFHHFDELKPLGVLDQIVDAVDGQNRVAVSKELRDYVLRHLPKECHDSIDWNSLEVEKCHDWG